MNGCCPARLALWMHETRSGSSCRSAHQSGWVGGMLSVSCPSRMVYVAADSARELRCRSRVFGEPLRTLYSRRLQADHGSPALRRSPMCRAVPSVATACRASSANYVFLCLRANSESGRTLRRSPRHKRGVDLDRTSGSAPVTAGEAAGSAGWPFARSLSHFHRRDLPRTHWWRLSGEVHITAVGSRRQLVGPLGRARPRLKPKDTDR